MKELLQQYARYNVWANQQFIKVLRQMTEEQVDMKIQSSFPTIRKTVYHMWSAEDIWMQRMELVERPLYQATIFEGTLEEALVNWEKTSEKLVHFVENKHDDEAFNHIVQYYDLNKRPSKVPIVRVLMQVFNHATYHRGQLVTMFRQAGVKKIPQTDFHVFAAK